MKSSKINTRTIIPGLTFILGLVWVFYGLKNYGWWDEGPGSGFFPAIIGILMSGISIIAFMEGRKLPSPTYIKASFHPFLAAIGTILAALIIGFFPAIIGILMSGISIIAFMEGRKLPSPTYIKASFHPFMAAIGTILAALVIGFFPALFLFVLGWMKLYEKFIWRKAVITSVITIATVFAVFVLWLRVPFPAGLIVDIIRG